MIEVTRKQFCIITKIYQLTMIAFMFTVIFAIGYLQDKLFETVLCLLGFLVLKQLCYYKIHSASMAKCFAYSATVFACISRLSLPLSASLLSAPLLGLSVAYGATRLSEHNIIFNTALKELSDYKKPFDCKAATAEEIYTRTRIKKLSEDKAEFVIDKFIKGKTYKQLCRLEESEKACQMRMKRIIIKLNAPI
ncbi:MAG: hypothetical protein RSC01_02505 [Oscillospiraceae bacterium]